MRFRNLVKGFYDLSKERKALLIVIVVYALFSIPNYFMKISSGLDNSWIFFLNLSTRKEFVFGENVFFTYGPLGFLQHVQNVDNNLWIGALIWLLIYCSHIFTLCYIFKHFRVNKVNVVMSVISVLLFILPQQIPGDEYLCYLALLSMSLIWMGNKRFIILFDVFMVVMFFLKFSSFFEVFSALIVFSIFYICIFKKIKTVLYMFCSIPISFVAYLIYNPSLKALYQYIKGAVEISSGYNTAMSLTLTSDGKWDHFDAYIFWVVIGIICCLTAAKVLWKIDKKYAGIFLTLLSPLYFYYKHGFVSIGSTFMFMGTTLMFSIIFLTFDWNEIFSSIRTEHTHRFVLNASLILVGLICVVYYNDKTLCPLAVLRGKTINMPVNIANCMLDEGEGVTPVHETFKEIIGDSSVVVFPWELSYMYDDDLNFTVMPVLQNYTAYTQWLDLKDAQFFVDSSTAPEYIIFSLETIANRLPLIETPATWRAIRNNYDMVDITPTEALLQRKDDAQYKGFQGNLLSSEKYTGDMLQRNMDAQYVSIDMDLGLWGSITKILWKIPEVNLEVTFNDGTQLTGRIVPDTLKEPFEIDTVTRDLQQVQQMLAGIDGAKVVSIQLSGEGLKFYHSIDINWYQEK